MGNSINDILLEDFQSFVGEILVRNRSVLDIISKMQTSTGRVNRAVIKAVTHCGCIEIEGKKQAFPEEVSIKNLSGLISTQLKGELCKECRSMIEKEIGGELFYIASLCNTFGISLYDVVLNEKETLSTLGNYSFR
ncbi:MAG: DUF1573 domain-containing protein [Christensenellales bacterium]